MRIGEQPIRLWWRTIGERHYSTAEHGLAAHVLENTRGCAWVVYRGCTVLVCRYAVDSASAVSAAEEWLSAHGRHAASEAATKGGA